MVLKEIYQSDGYSIMQNGESFNDIGHYHLHIFLRYLGDGFTWKYSDEKKMIKQEMVNKIKDMLQI